MCVYMLIHMAYMYECICIDVYLSKRADAKIVYMGK
jgi:hypothetical protein